MSTALGTTARTGSDLSGERRLEGRGYALDHRAHRQGQHHAAVRGQGRHLEAHPEGLTVPVATTTQEGGDEHAQEGQRQA